jgi:hypothetical protein
MPDSGMAKIVFDDVMGDELYYWCDFNILPRIGETIVIRHHDHVYNLTVSDIVYVLSQDYSSSRQLEKPKNKSYDSDIVLHCRCNSQEEVQPRMPYGDF